MKYLKYKGFLIFSCIAMISNGQCSFQYISNDTTFQDYIEFIYPRKNIDEIITIGSQINRGKINDTLFSAPVFQTFDNCGNILNKTIYKFIGHYKLQHRPIPTHSTFKYEPIGNTAINLKEDEFLIVDKAVDTILKKPTLVLFKINESGALMSYKTLELNDHESNQTSIKHVLKLKDGRLLVILWDYINEYAFYYFNENLDFIYKKIYNLGRGIRAIKEIENGEFVCTSLVWDLLSFQFYRLDSNGMIKWIVNPYNIYGSASEIILKNNKIYIAGGVSGFGVFMICDIDGNILNEFKYDTFFCQQRFCSMYLGLDNYFIISGYIKHCQSSDSSGSDLAIIKIDTNGTLIWDRLYDFRNASGASDAYGYYNDYGGSIIARANDGGIITNGISRYQSLSPGKVAHENALLVKTEPFIATNTNKQINKESLQFELLGNLINNYLSIKGPLDLIKSWEVFALEGRIMVYGEKWSESLNISNIESGMYTIKIIDRKNNEFYFKFVKI